MTLIACRTLYNQTKLVPAETLIQRPSVYGVVLHQRKVLVAQEHYTGKYVLPGGGVEKGEPIDAALKREFMEETGIEVEVGAFLHFQTDFFYYDPLEMAIHGFMFFYRCQPKTLELNPPPYSPEEGLDRPLWVDISDLSADSFMSHGALFMDLIRR